MGIFDFYATTIYLVSIFIFQFFVRPITKKIGKDTEWRRKAIPALVSIFVGSLGFWMIKHFSKTEITLEMVMWYIFIVALTAVYDVGGKFETFWKLLTNKFEWLKNNRPGEEEEDKE